MRESEFIIDHLLERADVVGAHREDSFIEGAVDYLSVSPQTIAQSEPLYNRHPLFPEVNRQICIYTVSEDKGALSIVSQARSRVNGRSCMRFSGLPVRHGAPRWPSHQRTSGLGVTQAAATRPYRPRAGTLLPRPHVGREHELRSGRRQVPGRTPAAAEVVAARSAGPATAGRPLPGIYG